MNFKIDYLNVPVLDLERSLKFYAPVLSILVLKVVHLEIDAIGFGVGDTGLVPEPLVAPVHIAAVAASTDIMQKFYAAALVSGGTDNRVPGSRPDYGKAYFSAYVYDSDGHNVEAVFRA